jgi:hypothetical protein
MTALVKVIARAFPATSSLKADTQAACAVLLRWVICICALLDLWRGFELRVFLAAFAGDLERQAHLLARPARGSPCFPPLDPDRCGQVGGRRRRRARIERAARTLAFRSLRYSTARSISPGIRLV